MEEWMLHTIAVPRQRPHLSLLAAVSQHPAQYFALSRLSINIQVADYQLAEVASYILPLSLPYFVLIRTVPKNTIIFSLL